MRNNVLFESASCVLLESDLLVLQNHIFIMLNCKTVYILIRKPTLKKAKKSSGKCDFSVNKIDGSRNTKNCAR